MFNTNLLLNGYAEPSTYHLDVTYAEYFRKFAREAREKEIGLWAYGEDGTTKGDFDSTELTSSTIVIGCQIQNLVPPILQTVQTLTILLPLHREKEKVLKIVRSLEKFPLTAYRLIIQLMHRNTIRIKKGGLVKDNHLPI